MTNNNKRLGVYLIFAFGIGWVLQVIGSVLALRGNQLGFTAALTLTMFAPLIAAIIAGKGIGKKKSGIEWMPRFKGCIGTWLGAWLGVILLAVVCAALYFVIFPDAFDPTFSEYLKASVGEETFEQTYGLIGTELIPVTMLFSVASSSFINMFAALGEEAGWRGYMQPILKERFGRVGGLVLGGLIWGVWHAPAILIAGYEYGWSLFTHPWWQALAGVVLFSLITVPLGIILDRMYEKSRSIWVPSLAHGAFNASAGIAFIALALDHTDELWIGPAPIGIISAIPLFVCAAIILMLKPVPTVEEAAVEETVAVEAAE